MALFLCTTTTITTITATASSAATTTATVKTTTTTTATTTFYFCLTNLFLSSYSMLGWVSRAQKVFEDCLRASFYQPTVLLYIQMKALKHLSVKIC